MRFKHLLKTTALATLLLFVGKTGWGQATLTESFDYTTPGNIGGNTSASGTSNNNWTTHSNSQVGTIDIISGNLSYPGLLTSIGNMILIPGSNSTTPRDVNRAFTTSNTVFYYSFVLNVIDNTQIKATADYFMSFGATAGTSVTSLGGRLGIKLGNVSGYRLSIQNMSSGTPTFTDYALDLDFGTTYLVVVKYDRSTSPTAATLWVNPTTLGSSEPAGSVSNNSGTGTFAAFASICIRNTANTPKAQIDELRTGATFADVTPKDATAPVVTFNPVNAATGIEPSSNIVISFNEAIRNTDDSPIADPTSLITLKETDGSGATVAFTASINAGRTQITIVPSTVKYSQLYYVELAAIEDASDNATIVQSSTFTTRAKHTTATISSLTYNVTGAATWTIGDIPADVAVETFEGNLASVDASTFNTYETTGTTPIVDGNPVLSGYVVKVTSEDLGTTNSYTLIVTPKLTAATSNNDVEHNFNITYPTDAAWQALITAVNVGGTPLAAADYDITVAGTITLKPTNGNVLLTTAGTKAITVVATGYADATVSQVINAGVPTATNSTIAPATPVALTINSTTSFTLTAKDQYDNLVSGYIFKYDATVTNTVVTTPESYTIATISTTATVADVALAATAAGVVTFDITVPPTVDGGDGISIQFQMNNGSTNLGSTVSYIAPTTPTVSASATLNETGLNSAAIDITLLNETFADATLSAANFTLNNAPTGVTVGGVTYLTTTTATVTLAYDGTDFDADVTNLAVVIAGSEFTGGNPLTSNDLTITALVEVAPTVTTAAAVTTNGSTTAMWEGTITADGGEAITEKGICWGTAADPTTAVNKVADPAVGTGITGVLTGLTVNTAYHVRAYAINALGTSYGADRTFTTLKSSAKAITATTIGTIDEANKKVTVPGPTKVSELKAAITVSPNATFEVYTAAAGTTAATATSRIATTMVVRVTAQDLTTQEYTLAIAVVSVDNLAALQALPFYTRAKYTGKATVTYARTYRNQKYIQDATAAVLVDEPTTAYITGTYAIGDGITNIEGSILPYYSIVELTPYATTGETCTGNPTITPVVKTMASLTLADQSKMVKVMNVTFTAATGNFATGTSYVINDGTSRDTVTLFRASFSEVDYIGTAIPTTAKDIVGLVSIFQPKASSKSAYQLVALSLAGFTDNGVGINENVNSKLNIYPNPFTNEIRFEGTENVKRVIITNITGQVIKNEAIDQLKVISTSELPKGMYIVTFMNDKGEKTTKKLVKE